MEKRNEVYASSVSGRGVSGRSKINPCAPIFYFVVYKMAKQQMYPIPACMT